MSVSGGILERKIYSVSELSALVQKSLERDFAEIWVKGQISGCKPAHSGHIYFALKDENAQISAVIFRFQAIYLRFQPEDGQEVVARGHLDFYAPRGDIQLIVDWLEPVGVSALYIKFEQLKKKLAQEGLFDPEHKKPIPLYPKRVAIISSKETAALRDILKITREKDHGLELLIIHSRVQGRGAEFELAEAIRVANLPEVKNAPGKNPLELIVLSRGGGSIEDLEPFNQEVLVRAIYNSSLPVITGIGHEIDYTLCDFVADLRLPTPTAVAEFLVQCRARTKEKFEDFKKRLVENFLSRIQKEDQTLKELEYRLPSPIHILENKFSYIDEIVNTMETKIRKKLEGRNGEIYRLEQCLARFHPSFVLERNQSILSQLSLRLNQLIATTLINAEKNLGYISAKIDALSPLATLSRGYSIARNLETKKIIRSVDDVKLNELLELILQRGELLARVEKKKG